MNNNSLDFGGSTALRKNQVLTNTYQLLGISMVPTIIGAFIATTTGFTLIPGSPIISALILMAVLMGLSYGVVKNSNSGAGVAWLMALTFVMGLAMGPLLHSVLSLRNGSTLVGLAAAGTSLTFLTMAGIATTTKRDLSGMGKFLTVGIILLILGSIANMFLALPVMSLVISGAGCLLFALWMMYDINRVVTGGETNYIVATLSVYLSIINFFQSILHLLSAFMGDRD